MIAYLTDSSDYTAYLRTASSSFGDSPDDDGNPPEFGVKLLGNMEYAYAPGVLVEPGASVKLEPRVKNTGRSYGIYVFVEATIPNDFTVDAINDGWYTLSESANTDSTHYIYYYGNVEKEDELMPLTAQGITSAVFDNISLSKKVGTDKSYIINITARAIQTIKTTTPTDVWELVNGRYPDDDG